MSEGRGGSLCWLTFDVLESEEGLGYFVSLFCQQIYHESRITVSGDRYLLNSGLDKPKLDLVICNTVTRVRDMTNKTIGQGRQYEQYSRR